jgi:hypothetical protein
MCSPPSPPQQYYICLGSQWDRFNFFLRGRERLGQHTGQPTWSCCLQIDSFHQECTARWWSQEKALRFFYKWNYNFWCVFDLVQAWTFPSIWNSQTIRTLEEIFSCPVTFWKSSQEVPHVFKVTTFHSVAQNFFPAYSFASKEGSKVHKGRKEEKEDGMTRTSIYAPTCWRHPYPSMPALVSCTDVAFAKHHS